MPKGDNPSLAGHLQKFYDAWAQLLEYDKLSPYDQIAIRRRAEVIFDLLQPKAEMRILDIGCGEGIQITILAKFAKSYACFGLDLATRQIEKARQRTQSASFVAASATQLPFGEGSFDGVICSEVLEHLPDYQAAIYEIYRILRPGGRAILSVPFEQNIGVSICIHCNKPTPGGGHLHSFRARDLSEALAQAGFVVEHCAGLVHAVSFFPRVPYSWWKRLQLFIKLRYKRPKYLFAAARKPGPQF